MPEILEWIQTNPSAVKGYLVTFLALLLKVILQFTGESSQLDSWNAALNQLVDLIFGAISVYGVIIGIIHTSRGPLPTPVNQTATIIAAIQGPPSPTAVAQAKEASAEVAAQK